MHFLLDQLPPGRQSLWGQQLRVDYGGASDADCAAGAGARAGVALMMPTESYRLLLRGAGAVGGVRK